MKTILLHVHNDASTDSRLETALSLARACGAHLSCLHVTPIEACVAVAPFDSVGGVLSRDSFIKALDDQEVRLRVRVEEKLRSEDVPWDYLQVTGNVPTQIIRHGALTDLIVVGREPHYEDFERPALGLLGDLLEGSRTPLFIPGCVPRDPSGPALVAWNGSVEAANAVRASLGLLKIASTVTVLQVTPTPTREGHFPPTRLLEYLSRHGIRAELEVQSLSGAEDQIVAAAILSNARSSGAYVVVGGYGHSRVREYLFGGVTRTMLGDADVPVVIAR